MQPDFTTLPGRGPLVVACAECGRPIRIFPSTLTYRPHPTCSRTCYGARQTRLAHEANSIVCVICETIFYAEPYYVAKQNRRACSLRCRAEWQRGRRIATPETAPERFIEKVPFRPDDGCWEWVGADLVAGYGAFFNGYRRVAAHRYAWEAATDDALTKSDRICHTCDNRRCVRNDDEGTYAVAGVLLPRRGHLFKGTDLDNALDKIAKGRHRTPDMQGELNPNARLTRMAVRAIRADAAMGIPLDVIAARAGVTRQMIRLIVERKNWRHIA